MRKQKLTQKEAARLIHNCGRTLVVRDGEFIVKLHGKTIDHKSTYFTNDLEDAVHTAKSAWLTEQTAARLATPPLPKLDRDGTCGTCNKTGMTQRELAEHDCTQGVVKIEYWWDRLSRNWILQAKDKYDNQIGAAEYTANSRTLPSALEAMREQYPGVTCLKWTDKKTRSITEKKARTWLDVDPNDYG